MGTNFRERIFSIKGRFWTAHITTDRACGACWRRGNPLGGVPAGEGALHAVGAAAYAYAYAYRYTYKIIKANMQIIRGSEIEKHIDQLGRFRIEIFREYPYLYDGNIEYERTYLGRYSRNSESFLLILQDTHGIIGACTGIPLNGENHEFQNAFVGENRDEIYYIGEVMLRADSRGKKLGSRLLSTALGLIDSKKFKKVSLCTVDRGLNHLQRPVSYCSPDYLWKKCGFEKSINLLAYLDWKDIGQEIETQKPMNIWFREHSKE